MTATFVNDHLIDSCSWRTTFDDEENAVDLQNYFSHWSHSAMPGIVDEVLNSMCPTEETWRIENLDVDLGSIDAGKLRTECPLRFRRALEHSLRRYLDSHDRRSIQVESDVSQGQAGSALELLEHFLITGSMPWWASDGISHQEVLLHQIGSVPDELAAMLRRVGQKEQVRHRMVMQWPESLIRRVVTVLEPEHHRYVEEFATAAQTYSDNGMLEQTSESGFRRQLWSWILMHLLVERGSIFNTVAFVRSTLERLAKHYNIVYERLLRLVVAATNELDNTGLRKPLFVQALQILAQDSSIPENSSDHTQHQLDNIRLQHKRNDLTYDHFSPTDVADFALRALYVSPAEVCALLRKRRERLAAEILIAKLSRDDLIYLIRHLAPDHADVLVQLEMNLAKLFPGRSAEALNDCWIELLLATTVQQSQMSAPRQIIDNVIRAICSAQSQHKTDLLASLMNLTSLEHSNNAQTLHELLHQLHLNSHSELQVQGMPGGRWAEALTHYLLTGSTRLSLRAHDDRDPIQVLSFFLLNGERHALTSIRLAMEKSESPAQVVRRLLELGSSAGYQQVLRLFDSSLARGIHELEAMLKRARRRGRLPSWRNTEFSYAYRASALRALLSTEGQLTLSNWLTTFTQLLAKETKIRRSAWLTDLGEILLDTDNDTTQEIEQWLEQQIVLSQPSIASKQTKSRPTTFRDYFGSVENRAEFTGFLKEGRLGDWFHVHGLDEASYLNYLLAEEPAGLRKCLSGGTLTAAMRTRLWAHVHPKKLLLAVQETLSTQQSDVRRLRALFNWVEKLRIPHISYRQIEFLLAEQLLTLWLIPQWSSDSVTTIVQFLTRFLLQQSVTSLTEVRQALEADLETLPPAVEGQIRKALFVSSKVTGVGSGAILVPKAVPRPAVEPKLGDNESEPRPGVSIPINNAGLVLLNGFFEMYLERLGLLENKQFINRESQLNAVHFLQYLATGQSETEEQFLLLNKLLCGLNVADAVPHGTDISDQHHELAEGLITACVGHWDAIGESSTAGFRGNWLVRDGSLIEGEDKWSLFVEKRAYDILLQRSPFSYSVIRYPWMQKPIYTTWMD